MFSLAIFFRTHLGLEVPNQRRGNAAPTKTRVGVISMLFHQNVGTKADKDSRILAQQSLITAGYNARLGVGQTPTHRTLYGDNFNTLYNSMINNLQWMCLDNDNLDPLGGG